MNLDDAFKTQLRHSEAAISSALPKTIPALIVQLLPSAQLEDSNNNNIKKTRCSSELSSDSSEQ